MDVAKKNEGHGNGGLPGCQTSTVLFLANDDLLGGTLLVLHLRVYLLY